MDVFVFFLQIQSRLKDQIREDYISVQPENSEAQRRIGAKGANSVIHVSPYGITLALQSNRAVLAQWPLKSIRCYESSGTCQLSIEAGRVAPMGDGLYIFQTRPGDANGIYDLLDQYVMDTVGRAQPNRRNNTEEIEDYVLEAERLLALTVVAACTSDNQEIQDIVQNNWNTDLNVTQSSNRPRQVVHTRLTGASSVASLNSQNSVSSPPVLPARNLMSNSARNTPQMARALPPARDSPAGSRKGSAVNLADRPPLPPPASTLPVNVPQRSQPLEPYLRMNSSASKSSNSPLSPWTPSSADWAPPPTFKEAMRQKSQSPIAENNPNRPTSYLSPTNAPNNFDAYLNPTPTGPVTSTPVQNSNALRLSIRDAYLTPSSVPDKNNPVMNGGGVANSGKHKIGKVESEHFVPDTPTIRRMRRLRSASCEDLSDYLRFVIHDPVSKSMNDLLEVGDSGEDDVLPEPFPRLQTFSGSIEMCSGHSVDNYYNIEGLHGKIYDGPGLTVHEIRKKFSRRCHASLRRSVSNPNFIANISKEELDAIRVKSGYGSPKGHSKRSLTSIIPDALKKRLSKDSTHHSSHGALSNGGLSSHNSSRASSNHSSRCNSLSRRTTSKEDIVAKTSVKGINVTKRSRSFRRQKAHEEAEPESKDKSEAESKSAEHKDSNGNVVSKDQEEIHVDHVDNTVETNALKKLPNIAPKPSPKPMAKPSKSKLSKPLLNSAAGSQSNGENLVFVTAESCKKQQENDEMATTKV